MSTRNLARTRPATRKRKLAKLACGKVEREQKEVRKACVLVVSQLERWAMDAEELEKSWWRRRWLRRLTSRAQANRVL